MHASTSLILSASFSRSHFLSAQENVTLYRNLGILQKLACKQDTNIAACMQWCSVVLVESDKVLESDSSYFFRSRTQTQTQWIRIQGCMT